MPDPANGVLVLGVLISVGVLFFGFHVVDAARDSDWWVIARGVIRGKVSRLRRAMRGGHRG